jgi:hypothetical protein
VESDLQRTAAAAQAAVAREITGLLALDLDLFNTESRVREHVHRLDPAIEEIVVDAVTPLKSAREKSVFRLHAHEAQDAIVESDPAVKAVGELSVRIDADIARLGKSFASDPRTGSRTPNVAATCRSIGYRSRQGWQTRASSLP